MIEEKHFTTSMQEAAALLSSIEFEVDYYDILPPSENSDRNRFVLKVYVDDKKQLSDYIRKYHNQRLKVEPKTYDQKINMLRDILNKNRG